MGKIFIVLLAFFSFSTPALAEDIIEIRQTTTPNLIEIESITTFDTEGSVVQQLYDTISKGLTRTEIDISEFNLPYTQEYYDAVFDIYCTAVYNHPQYGDLRTALHPGDPILGASGYMIFNKVVPYRLDDYDEEAYHNAVNYALSHVLTPEMTDFDKILSIHDYLSDKITYSTYQYEQKDVNNNIIIDFAPSVYTPYGALVNEDAVCQGYSLAFKLLCDYAGIECGYAISTIQSHIWNIVKYEGFYYHIDVTWDDPKTSLGKEYTRHRFLLLSDVENMLRRDYTDYYWTRNLNSPCIISGLNESLYCADKIDPFTWRDGKFWYADTANKKYYSVTDNKATEITNESDYLPNQKLDCEIFPAYDGVCAIDSYNSINTADLYAATYTDGKLSDVEKVDITFDEKGRAVANVPQNAKLMLFQDGTIKPIAYAK